jgi:hypothetical protein
MDGHEHNTIRTYGATASGDLMQFDTINWWNLYTEQQIMPYEQARYMRQAAEYERQERERKFAELEAQEAESCSCRPDSDLYCDNCRRMLAAQEIGKGEN